MTGYDRIIDIAKKHKLRITDLLVLAPQNDPFYAGSKSSREKAEWFANLWREFGYTRGIHLRRVHYQLVSQESSKTHNGKPLEIKLIV